jgi:hypothetical protein
MNNLYRGPSIDASYQVSVHLATRFQRRYFRNWPIRNKNCLFLDWLISKKSSLKPLGQMNWNLVGHTYGSFCIKFAQNRMKGERHRTAEPLSFHRCVLPNFSSFDQAVQRRIIFRNQPIRNKNCLWWPCLLTDRDEMSNL